MVQFDEVASRPPDKPAYLSVLHDMLLALLGFTGDVFVDADDTLDSNSYIPREPWRSTFKLAPGLSFLDPPERQGYDILP